MVTLKKIQKNIKIQREIEGDSKDLDLVEKVSKLCKTSCDWSSMVKVKFHRFGNKSFECHRFYYPSELLIKLKDFFEST